MYPRSLPSESDLAIGTMADPSVVSVEQLIVQVQFLTVTLQSVVRENEEQKVRIVQLEGAVEGLEISVKVPTPTKRKPAQQLKELKVKTDILYKAIIDGAQMTLRDMKAKNSAFKKRSLMTIEVRKTVQAFAVETYDVYRADVESGEKTQAHLDWTLTDLDDSIGNVANYKRHYVLDFFQFVYSEYEKSNGAGALDDYLESMSTESSVV